MSGSEGRSHTSPCDSTRASDCCPFRCYGARTGTIDNAGIVYVPVDHKQSFVRSLTLRCRPRFLGYDDELRRDILDQIYNCGVIEERFIRMEVRWMTLLRNRTSRGAKCNASQTANWRSNRFPMDLSKSIRSVRKVQPNSYPTIVN